MDANEFFVFNLEGLPDIKDDVLRGQMVVSAVKVKRLIEAFEYVERLHRSGTV